jgi:hypothetical protein
VADTSAWWLEGNTTTGTQGEVSYKAIPTIHGASLSGLSTVRISILKQSQDFTETKVRIDAPPFIKNNTRHSCALTISKKVIFPSSQTKVLANSSPASLT